MYPFSYDVIIYNEDDTYTRETGMSLCTSYVDAMATLEAYYGFNDLVEVRSLALYEENPVIVMPQAHIDLYNSEFFHESANYQCDHNGNAVPKEPIGEAKTAKTSTEAEPISIKYPKSEVVYIDSVKADR